MSLVVSIIALGLIITIHEFGHFAFAKLFGVGVIEFSIGMGPVLISKVFGETRYSLRLLPFGGSCMMLGEEDEEKEEGSQRKLNELTNLTFNGDEVSVQKNSITIDGREFAKESQFYSKPAWQRFLVIAAGPVFNFLLAFLFSLILSFRAGWDRPVILLVNEGSPAYEAGIREGDCVRSLETDGRKMRIHTARDIALFFQANAQQVDDQTEILFTVSRGNEKRTVSVRPAYSEAEGRNLVGISYSLVYQPLSGIREALPVSWYNIEYIFRSTFESLRMIFTGTVNAGEVSGVVGMVSIMDENVGEAAREGGTTEAVLTLLYLMIVISGSLGLTNLLPLPALDGGRLVFILIELCTGKAVPKKIEGYIHGAGMILLLGLMVLIMANDIWKLIR